MFFLATALSRKRGRIVEPLKQPETELTHVDLGIKGDIHRIIRAMKPGLSDKTEQNDELDAIATRDGSCTTRIENNK